MTEYRAIQGYYPWYPPETENTPTMTVHDTERQPIDTGLVDAHGVPLFRMPDHRPMGFQPNKPRIRVKAGRA